MRFALILLLPLLCFAEKHTPAPCVQSDQPSLKGLISADFLFWSANIDGTQLVLSDQVVSATELDRSAVNLNGKLEPGVRVSLGMLTDNHDKWRFSLVWTWYHGKSDTESPVAEGGGYLRQGWGPFLGPYILSASGQSAFNMNLADFKISRTYPLTRRLAIAPYVAARAAFTSIRLTADYSAAWASEDMVHDITFYTASTQFEGRSKYSSGGIVTGTGLIWSLGSGFSLFGDIGATLLYGRHQTSETFNGYDLLPDDSLDPELDPVISEYTDNNNSVRAALDLLFGIRWQATFQKNRRVSLFAGYELFQWFSLNRLFTISRTVDSYAFDDTNSAYNVFISSASQNGDVGLQGLTTKLNFEF